MPSLTKKLNLVDDLGITGFAMILMGVIAVLAIGIGVYFATVHDSHAYNKWATNCTDNNGTVVQLSTYDDITYVMSGKVMVPIITQHWVMGCNIDNKMNSTIDTDTK